MKRRITPFLLCFFAALICSPGAWSQDDRFASQVVAYEGIDTTDPLYGDPNAVLGKPTTLFFDGRDTWHRSLAAGAFNTAPDGSPLITKLGDQSSPGSITVKFDQPIVHDPAHWYGMDFQVFGNAFFVGDDFIAPNTDMEQYRISDGSVFGSLLTVSVSPDNVNWYTYSATAGGYYPSNPFAWDRVNHTWGEELDWTRPVDPSLGPADFAGLSAADAIDLYNGSAGGAAFSLADSGYDSIQYIRVTSYGGVIDGFSRVGTASPSVSAAVPEPGTLDLLALGMISVAVRCRRRRAH